MRILSTLLLIFFTFSLTAQNPTIQVISMGGTISPGQSCNYHVDVNSVGSFSQQLFFNVTSTDMQPTWHSDLFNPSVLNSPYAGGTDLVLTTSGSIPIGTYSIVVTASNGPFSTTDTCYLTISEPEPDCEWSNLHLPNGYSLGIGLIRDHNGNFWIPNSNALLKYDKLNWTLYNNSNSNFPAASYGINSIKCDSLNNIWIGVEQTGLVKFDGTFWTLYTTSSSSIPSNNITGLDIDLLGNIWLSTDDQGIGKFDGVNWTIYNTGNSNLQMDCTRKIKADRQGNIWVAGYNNNSTKAANFIAKFNGSTFTTYDNANSCFTHAEIFSNFAFDHNNNLWFNSGIPQMGIHDVGLVKFNETSWECWLDSITSPFNHYIKTTSCSIQQQDNSSKLPVSYSREVLFDVNDNLWIAHLNNSQGWGTGITKYDGISWKTFVPSNSTIPIQAVFGMYWENDTLWDIGANDFYNFNTGNNYLTAYSCDNIIGLDELDLKEKGEVVVYPNPFVDELNFSSENSLFGCTVKFMDLTGREIYSCSLGNNLNIKTPSETFNSGIYFYQIKENNSIKWTGKIIAN